MIVVGCADLEQQFGRRVPIENRDADILIDSAGTIVTVDGEMFYKGRLVRAQLISIVAIGDVNES